MFIWFILLTYSVQANQVDIRQMNFQILSNSYFNAANTLSIILQNTIPRNNSTFVGCPQLCLSMGSSCNIAVYNNTNQICTIYNTTIGIQQTSSCCTTFVNGDMNQSFTLPSNPQTSNISSLFTGRRLHTATLLSSGQVLIVGGRNSTIVFSSCELYSPQNQTWTVVTPMNSPRVRHTATILTMNNVDLVFVIGGYYTTANDALASVEYYNSSSGLWTMIANNMSNARYSHSTTLLKNGRFLVAGGTNAPLTMTSPMPNSEIFDPNTSTWQTVGSLNTARMQHMDSIFINGNAFVAGGANSGGPLQSCEIFDINLQSWSAAPNLANPRNLGSLISLLSISNSLLITGGVGMANVAYSSTDLYYPSTNTIIASSDMTNQRFTHSSNLMYYQSTPLVVVAGGYNAAYIGINSVQLYIVENSTWINLTGLNTGRGEHTATILNTSPLSMLIVGGRTDLSATAVLSSVELITF